MSEVLSLVLSLRKGAAPVNVPGYFKETCGPHHLQNHPNHTV
jgi:hypothetical protein